MPSDIGSVLSQVCLLQILFSHKHSTLPTQLIQNKSSWNQVNYRHPELTKRQVGLCLFSPPFYSSPAKILIFATQVQTLVHHYKGLSPKKDKFTFNDGQERDLINIQVGLVVYAKMLNVLLRVRSRCPIGVRTTTSQSRCTSSTRTPIMHLSATSSRPRICRWGERDWLADSQKAKGFAIQIRFGLLGLNLVSIRWKWVSMWMLPERSTFHISTSGPIHNLTW